MEKDVKPPYNMLLRNARIEKGWTQQKLADMVADELAYEEGEVTIDKQSVGRWERREVFPSSEVIPALCNVLGKNCNELGLLWELYHPANENEKADPAQAITDAEPEEEQPILPPVTPTMRNPLKEHWLLITIVSCVILLGIIGSLVIPPLWRSNSTSSGTITARSDITASPCASAPILVDPVDGQTLNTRTVTLTWEAPRGCLPEGYTVRITPNYDSEAKPWIVDMGWAPTFYKYTFSTDGTYYWYIRACKPCTPFHPGEWAIRVFTIQAT